MMRVMNRMVQGRARADGDRHAGAGHAAGRGPHHLRARRCGGLADPGADPAFPAGDGTSGSTDLQARAPSAALPWRRSRIMAKAHRRRHRGRGRRTAPPCCRRAKPPARRSRASATTTGCRSPAIAACAWSRSRRRRQAGRLLRLSGRRRHGGPHRQPDGAQGAPRRDGIPADQPSARLPDLRPGRRMRSAGPGHGLRLRRIRATTKTSAR